ncbi:MAG: ribonucleoside-diphosphate reductase subunit alpha [Deltaproteobacteria bacterium]|nr:ribonucleoside-diphosphate reductase subunit alpha [Deltaproteobacteria bacterium]|tara:strand:+ start:55298 stop:58075 length:2778 start_codon:yes stop_codon:yes gene_type:complete
MQIEKIKKRTGHIVDFQPDKITTAILKAMRAVRGRVDEESISELTTYVLDAIDKLYGRRIPDVEGIQDQVERALMERGYFDVARAYILYRERQRSMRLEQRTRIEEKIKKHDLMVTKRNGEQVAFDEHKIERVLRYAVRGYEGVIDVEKLLNKCREGIYEGMPTAEIARLAVITTRAFIEEDPSYDVITTRLFLSSLYKEVIREKFNSDDLSKRYREAFKRNLQLCIDSGRMDAKLLNFDMETITSAIDPGRDNVFAYRGLQTLYDRYLQKDADGQCLESPQGFWMRVAMGLSVNEPNKEETAIKFYQLLSSLRFVSSTPTLFHSGTTHPQLSSCYLTKVDDDLDHIFKCIGDNARLSKWSGGLGNDWTSIRAMGAGIKSTGVESQGVIPFLKIANDTTAAINRSGKRRGATCAYLENWHLDIEDFLDLRRNTGDERRRTHDMNTAVWIPDLFMKRVLENKTWTLFSPDDVPELHELYGEAFEARYREYEADAESGKIELSRRINAGDLWKKMITRLFETGHPWITFKDPCNVRSPQDHDGVVHSSNLCTEITLNTSAEETAVCNLGSVNLSRHIKNGKLDHALIEDTVTTAMRMLDNVVDINFYPTPEARHSNLRHRPVGLGVMGFQDALYALDYCFDSEEAMDFADESMELISYYAILGSSRLAEERGAYETFKGSKWDRGLLPVDTIDLLEKERGVPIEVIREGKLDWTPVRESIKQHGMRNSNCMAIAPTATISNISGCFPATEPIYKNLYVKSNMSGEFTVANYALIEDLKSLGVWNPVILEEIKFYDGAIQNIESIPQHLKDKYKTAFDIDAEWLIRAAARRGKWIDQSQSLNIFLQTTSGRRISEVYQYAWKMGLKTTYYLRTIGASSVEKSTVDMGRFKQNGNAQGLGMQQAQAEPPVPETKDAFCDLLDPTCEACQ